MRDGRGFRGYYGNRHTKAGLLGFELKVAGPSWAQEFAHEWKIGSIGLKSSQTVAALETSCSDRNALMSQLRWGLEKGSSSASLEQVFGSG